MACLGSPFFRFQHNVRGTPASRSFSFHHPLQMVSDTNYAVLAMCSPRGAPTLADPTFPESLRLHRCFARTPREPDQETPPSSPPHTAARTLSSRRYRMLLLAQLDTL